VVIALIIDFLFGYDSIDGSKYGLFGYFLFWMAIESIKDLLDMPGLPVNRLVQIGKDIFSLL